MAHFAEIDENNIVKKVLVVDNSQEHRGQEFLAVDCNLGGTWIQTSYNNNFRGKFAGIGDTYDPIEDKFYSSSPYPSWTLNKSTGEWNPPTACPKDGKNYKWVEEDLSWQELIPESN